MVYMISRHGHSQCVKCIFKKDRTREILSFFVIKCLFKEKRESLKATFCVITWIPKYWRGNKSYPSNIDTLSMHFGARIERKISIIVITHVHKVSDWLKFSRHRNAGEVSLALNDSGRSMDLAKKWPDQRSQLQRQFSATFC